MVEINISRAHQVTMAEVPYIKLQKVPDFILAIIGNTLNDTIKTAILTQANVGLHSWIRRNLDTLIKGKKIARTGTLTSLWDDYLDAFDTNGVSAKETKDALIAFQTAACLGSSYIKLPSAANMARFFTKRSEVPLPMASATEINDKRGEPNYGHYIEGKISDMMALYQQNQFNRRVPSNKGQRRTLIGANRDGDQ